MAYYCWRLGGVRRTTSAGRLGGLRILRCMTGLETMCGDDFCPGTDLNLEKMQRPLQNQERTIVERRQGRLDSVMANQHKARQEQILWKGCGRWRVVVVCLKRSAAS
jgi:hypothetical protein